MSPASNESLELGWIKLKHGSLDYNIGEPEEMTATSSKTDLLYEITYNPKFVLRRSPRVNVKTAIVDGEKSYFMKNHETGTLYIVNEPGNDVWNLIDGKRTVKQISEEMESTRKDLEPNFAKDSLLYYAEEGVLESASEPEKKTRLTIANAFMMRVALIWKSNDFIQSIHRLVQPLLKKWLLWPMIALFIVMGLLFAGSFVTIFTHKENFEIMGSSVVGFFFYYFVALAPIIAIHEISHGLALVHYGGAPREMGTGLYFFNPMFYIDVTDGWTLSRHQRIMVYAAGTIAEMSIASAIMIAQLLWQFPPSVSHILTMVVFYCFYGMLIDLSPLLETDGYFIFCDIVNIQDLRQRSLDYIKAIVRKPFKKTKKEKTESIKTKTKAILLLYAAMAVAWALYLILRTLTIVSYMGQDTAVSVLNISSAILLNSSITVAAIVISVASILYFSMVISGYGLALFVALRKAFRKTLQLEAIHDRDFSVFLPLPKNVSESLFTSLKKKMASVAKNLTRDFSVRQTRTMCVAVLRMSSAKLAIVQIKEHFRNVEEKFDAVYSHFLRRHKNEIMKSIGVYGSQETSLATLLLSMGKQAASAGISDAKAAVSQIIERQARTALYLLHSAYGRVWTVELPPNLLNEIGETLLPGLLVEDLSITDMYDEVEDFKKRTIYGFDSLAKLAIEDKKCLQETVARPEKYQVISCMEPIKSRLIIVGRTEHIESIIDLLGGLFICQTWCGYLDNLLSEVNLSLLALSNSTLPTAEAIRSMKDGELAVLERNLSMLVEHESPTNELLRNLKSECKWANLELEQFGSLLKPTEEFSVGLINTTLQVNAENLAHLPSQAESFGILCKELFAEINKTGKIVKRELGKRKSPVASRIRRRLSLAPFFIVLSAFLAFLGLLMFAGYVTLILLACALLLQLSYWTAYFSLSRSYKTIDRYPSLAFRQVHFYTFSLAKSLYTFMTSVKVLSPTKPDRQLQQQES